MSVLTILKVSSEVAFTTGYACKHYIDDLHAILPENIACGRSGEDITCMCYMHVQRGGASEPLPVHRHECRAHYTVRVVLFALAEQACVDCPPVVVVWWC